MFDYDLDLQNIDSAALIYPEDQKLLRLLIEEQLVVCCDNTADLQSVDWEQLSDFGKCLYIHHSSEWDEKQLSYMEALLEEEAQDCEMPDDLEEAFEQKAIEGDFYCRAIEPYLKDENEDDSVY